MDKTEQLARKFSELLKAEMGSEIFREMVKLNETPGFKDTDNCASHNYCDANIVMYNAFETLVGGRFDIKSDESNTLWNAAWKEARVNKFYIDESAISEEE